MEKEKVYLKNIEKKYIIKEGALFNKNYKEINALNDISLSINSNETLGLIGLNGAGKSPLIKIILGILTSDCGEINVLGNNPHKNRVKNMRRVGVVFGQRPQIRWDISPLDSYLLNKEIYQINEDEFKKNLDYFSEQLDIKGFWKRPVRTLSLGQKMRADLVASLLHSPELLIMDEPTLGLDIVSKRKIIELIKEIKKNTTIIYTSHHLNDVLEISDKIVILNKGKLVANKTSFDISKEIGFFSIHLILETAELRLSEVSKNEISIKQLSKYEYTLSEVHKDKLKIILNDIYSNNQVNNFEIKEDNLEKLLKKYSEKV